MMSEVEWLEEFRINLLRMMDEDRITQKELADDSGLSEASISYYVNGTKMPGVRAIVNLAYALDCSTDDLIDFGEMIEG